ncbi:hypothetical protein AVEN_68218-1, partial [Araneus ventricosus]
MNVVSLRVVAEWLRRWTRNPSRIVPGYHSPSLGSSRLRCERVQGFKPGLWTIRSVCGS